MLFSKYKLEMKSFVRFVLMAIVLLVLRPFDSSTSEVNDDKYIEFLDNFGGQLCLLTSPNQTVTHCRSLIYCSGQCSLNVQCGQFNFWSKKKSCQLFYNQENSTRYSNVDGCSH